MFERWLFRLIRLTDLPAGGVSRRQQNAIVDNLEGNSGFRMRSLEEEDRRALLFGQRGDGGAHRRSVTAMPNGTASANEREMLEAANDEKVDGLRGRVGEMRHLALDIGTEMNEQNRLLDGMGGTFDNAGEALGRTIAEVKRLARSGSGGHICAMFVFAFVFFVLVYLLLR